MSENHFKQINKITNVSRETFQRIDEFVTLLLKWNKKINLISRSDESQIWERHIYDSVQLSKYIGDDVKIITDMGSGGGFPAIVLSLLKDWEFNLIESDQRKCAFLRESSRLSLGKINVFNERIEKVSLRETDLITARALASLDKLFNLSSHFFDKTQKCVFLKGQNVVEEIEEASKYWQFSYEINPSLIDQNGVILQISSVSRKV